MRAAQHWQGKKPGIREKDKTKKEERLACEQRKGANPKPKPERGEARHTCRGGGPLVGRSLFCTEVDGKEERLKPEENPQGAPAFCRVEKLFGPTYLGERCSDRGE